MAPQYDLAGIDVVGVSFDTPAENKEFATNEGFPFPLLCDVSRQVGLAYGACDAPDAQYPKRITYVIAGDGTIEQAIETKDPGGQAKSLLEACS